MSTISQEHKAKIVRCSDNIKNLAKELKERDTPMSGEELNLVSAKLTAAATELTLIHEPGPLSAPSEGPGVASGNFASSTVNNPSGSEAPGTLPAKGHTGINPSASTPAKK
jgi:hypothetical protein